jgi:hypothetical protein
MLDELRKSSRSGIIYFLFAIIILVFVFTFNTGGPGSGGAGCSGGDRWVAANINGSAIDEKDLDLALRLSADAPADPADLFGGLLYRTSRFARLGLTPPDIPANPLAGGDAFAPVQSFSPPPESVATSKARKVVDDMIESWIASQKATDLGLRVSDTELTEAIIRWVTREQGEFTANRYENVIRYGLKTSKSHFESFVRRELLRNKLIAFMTTQVGVSSAEVDFNANLMSRRVILEHVRVSADAISPTITVSDEAIAAKIGSSGEALQAEYDKRTKEFNLPERVQLRGIFKGGPFPAQIEYETDENLKTEMQAQRDAARDELTTFLAQLRAPIGRIPGTPDPMVTLATSDSEDNGSKDNGGLFPKALTEEELGRYPFGPNLAKAAFALESGGFSEVIETNRGFWIVRLEQKLAPESTPLEKAHNQLAREMLQKELAAAQIDTVAAELITAMKADSTATLSTIVDQWNGAHPVPEGTSLLSNSLTAPMPLINTLGDNISWRRIPGTGCSGEAIRAGFKLSADAPIGNEAHPVQTGPDCDVPSNDKLVIRFKSLSEPSEDELVSVRETVKLSLENFQKRQTWRAWYRDQLATANVELTSQFRDYLIAQQTAQLDALNAAGN